MSIFFPLSTPFSTFNGLVTIATEPLVLTKPPAVEKLLVGLLSCNCCINRKKGNNSKKIFNERKESTTEHTIAKTERITTKGRLTNKKSTSSTVKVTFLKTDSRRPVYIILFDSCHSVR